MLFRSAQNDSHPTQHETITRLYELSDVLTNCASTHDINILLQNVCDIILITDNARETIYNISASFANALNTNPTVFYGKKIAQFIHPADTQNFNDGHVTRWRRANGNYVRIKWATSIRAQKRLYTFGKIIHEFEHDNTEYA